MPHYYAVIDFECTCWQAGDEEKKAHEIIEFPAVFMNSKTLEIEFEFHEYVRPTENPILTPFCVELTGISQATVDAADDLEAVLSTFDDFLKENKIDSFTACTDGPWDFSQFLAPEVTRKSLAVPKWARKWIDIRRRFQYTFQLTKWIGVSDMLVLLNMEFEGREHSGIDDARNIARIVKAVHKQRGKGHLKPNRNKMVDYTATLAAAQQNFQAAGPAAMDPTQTVAQQIELEDKLASRMDEGQAVMQCHGDYNKIPYGWRQSPFMGKCGFKIQLNNFYSADSPCYPIQDISCMGPVAKKAWARMCKTEFPCKPPVPPTFPKPYRAPPGLFAKNHVTGPSTLELVLKVFNESIFPVLGVVAGCCLIASLASKNDDPEKSDVVSETSASIEKLN